MSNKLNLLGFISAWISGTLLACAAEQLYNDNHNLALLYFTVSILLIPVSIFFHYLDAKLNVNH